MLGVLNSQTTGKLILRDQDVKKSHMYHHLVKSGKLFKFLEILSILWQNKIYYIKGLPEKIAIDSESLKITSVLIPKNPYFWKFYDFILKNHAILFIFLSRQKSSPFVHKS